MELFSFLQIRFSQFNTYTNNFIGRLDNEVVMESYPTLYWNFLLLFFSIYARKTHAVSNYCVDHGYTPQNGSRSPPAGQAVKYFEGSVIRYSCDSGYKLDSDVAKQTCTFDQDGIYMSWLPPKPPTCIEKSTCTAPYIVDGTTGKYLYSEGETLKVVCKEGYEATSKNKPICMSDGNWSFPPPGCQEKICPEIPDVPFGICKHDRIRPGSRVVCTCNQGYHWDGYLNLYNSLLLTCVEGEWTPDIPACVPDGCMIPHYNYHTMGIIPSKSIYNVGDHVDFYCLDTSRSPVGKPMLTCLEPNIWSDPAPTCNITTTSQMPYTSNGNVFCPTPLPVTHGKVFCCDDDDSDLNVTKDSIFCCPVNGVVQFVCDVGYSVQGEATQWVCGPHGDWMLVGAQGYRPSPEAPTCENNITRSDDNQMPDEMLKPVLGTAAGVLLVLSAAIVVAFCRPKFKDMKRRWREMREDEEELIIDGRRILLPSYEEAVGSPHDPYIQVHTAGDDMPGPSNISGRNRQKDSRDDVSCILEVHAETSGVRTSSGSSDEDILVPHGGNSSSDVQPILENIETVQSDKMSFEQLDNQSFKSKTDEESSQTRQNTQSNSTPFENSLIPWYSPPTDSDSDPDRQAGFADCSGADSDTCLDSIRPKILQSRNLEIVNTNAHILHTFPLKIEQVSQDNSHVNESFSVELNMNSDEMEVENSHQSSAGKEDSSTSEEEDPVQNDTCSVPGNGQDSSCPSDHVRLVPTGSNHLDSGDLTSSTTV